jgi:uncharacterized protein (DUF2062 family)
MAGHGVQQRSRSIWLDRNDFVVFKRRDPVGWVQWLREMVYPTGGFRRAMLYVLHRMRRLPDAPHRVARGVFAGCLIGFLPLPGIQFLSAAALAWAMRGNIFAALLGTFNSNPITTPFFAVGAISLGHWMLGIDTPLSAEAIGAAFGEAGRDLWHNVIATFGPEQMHWHGLADFWRNVYVPYFIGALVPGFVLSLGFYHATIPLVGAYQKGRAAKAVERLEKRMLLREKLAVMRAAAERATDKIPGDDGPPSAT